jgi:hypothetical protein
VPLKKIVNLLNYAETMLEFLEQWSDSNFSGIFNTSQAPHISKVEKEQEN